MLRLWNTSLARVVALGLVGMVLLSPPVARAAAPTAAVAEEIVAELLRPGCPALFDRLTPSFQQSVPRERWPSFCAGIAAGGERKALAAVGQEDGFAVYRLTLATREAKVGLAVDGAGRISGLYVKPWPAAGAEVPAGRVTYRWPLRRPTRVAWGGATLEDNAHAAIPRQQRALDLVFVDTNGKTFSGDGARNADYLIDGAEVVAAADGKVLVAVDGVPDNRPGVLNDLIIPGNMVAIEHGPNEIAHYCHLRSGTLRVKAGDLVKAGQVIGLVGNSGNSSEPHLHFHVQTAVEVQRGVGVDATFVDVCRFDGKDARPVTAYRPRKGDVVGPCPAR